MQADEIKHKRLIEKLQRELGQPILSALANPDIIEIMLNDDGRVWLDSRSQGMYATEHCIDPMLSYNIIATMATLRNRTVNESSVCLECSLPIDGSRFTALVPEAVQQPVFNIRKRALSIYTLDDYCQRGMISPSQLTAIHHAIDQNASILIVGGPGTGKTTFANALLHEMVTRGLKQQRFVIIEETPELQCSALNKIMIRTTDTMTMQKALRHALVSRPDKICVGECRGPEILILLKAWNTGTQGGISTVHANDAEAALSRIEGMVEENEGIKAQPHLICEAIDYICALSFHSEFGRRLNQIVKLNGYQKQRYLFERVG